MEISFFHKIGNRASIYTEKYPASVIQATEKFKPDVISPLKRDKTDKNENTQCLSGLEKDLHTSLGISFLNSHLVVSGMCLQNDHTLDFNSLGTIYLKRDHSVAEKKKKQTCAIWTKKCLKLSWYYS